jgi:hypothetical protein
VLPIHTSDLTQPLALVAWKRSFRQKYLFVLLTTLHTHTFYAPVRLVILRMRHNECAPQITVRNFYGSPWFTALFVNDRYRSRFDRLWTSGYPPPPATLSMHQILHLDELVRNISHCADSTNKGSASLLALACCCKSLEGPVMDVLWNRQIDLHVILRTLPADSWTVIGDNTTGVFVRERLNPLIVSWTLPKS